MSNDPYIQKQEVKTLQQFYDLMSKTGKVRGQALDYLLQDKPGEVSNFVQELENALNSLQQVKDDGSGSRTGKVLLVGSSQEVQVDLGYEISELEKDIFFLQNGEEEFFSYLQRLNPGFEQQVSLGLDFLKDKHFSCFVTDRDGTVNNYCGRYRSSIQSVYNALFLTRFARKRADNPIIVTSGPLQDTGILDVSITPRGAFVYAASKGREFMDLQGRISRYPIEEDKQAILDKLNAKLQKKVHEPGFEKFALIGSGLQFKFGQTTIARQDVNNSVAAKESQDFLKIISGLVQEIDPEGDNLRIEDTGLDIEIILTVGSGAGLKDFDKGDAVNYLDQALDLHMERGEHLVCGDTFSDLPMLKTTMEKTTDTYVIFVSRDAQLSSKVQEICPNSLIVTCPDILVAILGRLP
jgi:chaperonin cofactor prefoldin